jgi:hypothetical protein
LEALFKVIDRHARGVEKKIDALLAAFENNDEIPF